MISSKILSKWQRIAKQFFTTPSMLGDFYRTLCMAIQFADPENTARLRKSFPELVAEIKGDNAPTSFRDKYC